MTSDRRSRRPQRPPQLPDEADALSDERPTDEIPAVNEEPGDFADEGYEEEETSEFDGRSPIQQELARRGLKDMDEDFEEVSSRIVTPEVDDVEDDGETYVAPPGGLEEEDQEVETPEDLSASTKDEEGAMIFGDEEVSTDDAGPTFVGNLPAVSDDDLDEPSEKTEILSVVEDEAPPDVPMLLVETAEGTSDVEVADEIFVLGRAPDCHVVLPDQLVSRNHAAIEHREDGWYLVDQNSGNGTFLNDERISESLLYDGDLIQIGDAAITFTAPGSEPPADRPRVEKTMMLQASDAGVVQGTQAGPVPKPKSKRTRLIIIAGCIVVLIGILGIAKKLTSSSGPSPEEIAAQKKQAQIKRHQELEKQAREAFEKVKAMAKEERWTEALPLIRKVAAVLSKDKMVAEYLTTIEREDAASKAMVEAQAKVAVDDFESAIGILNTIPKESMQAEKAQILKKQMETKRLDYKLEAARKALDTKEYEKVVILADEVLSADPSNTAAAELKHRAEAKLHKPVVSAGRRKKRKRIVRPPTIRKSRTLLIGDCLVDFRAAKIDGALAKATTSGVSSEGNKQLRKFQKLYSRGTELARNPGQAPKAEKFLLQALTLSKKLGGGKGKITKDLHAKLGKVYFVKGVDAHNRRRYPQAFSAYKSALKYRPDLKQAQTRMATLEGEARKLYETAYVIKSTQPDKAIIHCKTVMKMVKSNNYAYGRCKKLINQLKGPGDMGSHGDGDGF
ncbi:MAG: FHA domain-containing protein [Deltaproteobacteria bacterium]|nr:FHA domain-containing protein [Deltaproteobacteria bacterium]